MLGNSLLKSIRQNTISNDQPRELDKSIREVDVKNSRFQIPNSDSKRWTGGVGHSRNSKNSRNSTPGSLGQKRDIYIVAVPFHFLDFWNLWNFWNNQGQRAIHGTTFHLESGIWNCPPQGRFCPPPPVSFNQPRFSPCICSTKQIKT